MNGFAYGFGGGVGDLGLTLGRMDSANTYQLAVSQSMRADLFGLNMSFSVGPSTSRFGLDRMATNMSQMSVGGFKMQKEIGINQNGEVIASLNYEHNLPTNGNMNPNAGVGNANSATIDFDRELDNLMFNQSINVSKGIDVNQLHASISENDKHNANHNNGNGHHAADGLNDLISLPCNMTNSQEMEPYQKSIFKSLMNKSRPAEDVLGLGGAASRQGSGQLNILLGESTSMNNRQQNKISVNLTQFQHENFYRQARMHGAPMNQSFNNINSNNNNNNYNNSNINNSINNNNNNNAMQMSHFYNRQNMFQISLIDKKIDTRSEPDYDVSHMREFLEDIPHFTTQQSVMQQQQQQEHLQQQQQQQQKQMTSSAMQESTSNMGMTIEPFVYGGNEQKQVEYQHPQNHQHQQSQNQQQQQQQQNQFGYSSNHVDFSRQFAHSDDEGTTTNKVVNRKKISKLLASPLSKPLAETGENSNQAGTTLNQKQKGSQYRQSRHKNVFKNFGGTLVRFIIYNQYFQERVIKELDKDAQKQKAFHDWLQNSVKLERKKDFQVAWTTFKSDSETTREYKALLRELSKDFFENFSFIYLINSKKISDMEIHLRSIHTYLAAINQPDSLERFKPV